MLKHAKARTMWGRVSSLVERAEARRIRYNEAEEMLPALSLQQETVVREG